MSTMGDVRPLTQRLKALERSVGHSFDKEARRSLADLVLWLHVQQPRYKIASEFPELMDEFYTALRDRAGKISYFKKGEDNARNGNSESGTQRLQGNNSNAPKHRVTA